MIPIEKQVCAVEYSLRLAEHGVPQESLFEYRQFSDGEELFWSKPILVGSIPKKMGAAHVGFGEVAAFTLTELLEKIPYSIHVNDTTYCFEIKKIRDIYHCGYHELQHWRAYLMEQDDNPADMLARTLIYLIEKGHVSVEKLPPMV